MPVRPREPADLAACIAAVNVGAYSYPTGIVITGSTTVVLDSYGGQVSLFSIRARHVHAPVTVGDFPVAVAITG